MICEGCGAYLSLSNFNCDECGRDRRATNAKPVRPVRAQVNAAVNNQEWVNRMKIKYPDVDSAAFETIDHGLSPAHSLKKMLESCKKHLTTHNSVV